MGKGGKMMKRDIEWLKAEIDNQAIIMDKGYIHRGDLMYLIDKLDEPEVLSQKWIDRHAEYYEYLGYAVVPVDKLKSLLVPKQGELETKIQELIESYKQEDGAYSNPENGWISGFVEDLKNLVAEEPLYHALIKGHELLADHDALSFTYWNFNMSKGYLLHGNQFSKQSRFLTKMTKEEWFELGINDSNADFVKVEN